MCIAILMLILPSGYDCGVYKTIAKRYENEENRPKRLAFGLFSRTFQCLIFGEEERFLCVKKPEEVFALSRKIGSMTVDGAWMDE